MADSKVARKPSHVSENTLIWCVYVSIAPHYYDFDFKLTSDAKIQPVFLKYRRGRPFLTIVTRWSRSTSNFYALIG